MQLPDALGPVADRQSGLLTRAQLARSGVTRATVRWHLGRGWRLVLPGVVALFTGAPSPRQRLVATLLWAGPSAQLSGLTALRWHGLTDLPDDGLVRVLVDWGSTSRRESFALRRRTSRMDAHAWRRGPLVVCSRARALVDGARELGRPHLVRALLLEATQRRLVRESDLRHELEAGAVRGSAVVRAALRDVATGAWSLPELDVLQELARSPVLPRVWPNPRLVAGDGTTLPSPDFWLDDVGLAGQVHSRSFHLRDADWEGTVSGDTVYAEHAVPVVGVTPMGFTRDPVAFRARVERAYLACLRTGRRPDVRMTPRGSGAD